MTVLQTTLVDTPSEEWRLAIVAPLLAFNEAQAGPSHFEHLVIGLTDGEGAMQGGLWGVTAYGWLYMQLLAVPEGFRGQGYGRNLVLQAEAEALRRGCHHAWVDTIFGAKGFYQKLGYDVFGALDDYPIGFKMTFLKKDLRP